MKQRGIDWQDARQREAFAKSSQLRLAKRIRDAALAIKPGLLLYFNGVGFEDQQDIGTYLEFECLPTGGWGYEILPVYARYLRNLGKPVLNMTGRFHRSWGDFGGIRTEASLEYDCISGLANGLGSCVGDHWHPRGEPNEAVFDLIRRARSSFFRPGVWGGGQTRRSRFRRRVPNPVRSPPLRRSISAPGPEISAGMPDMPLNCYLPGVTVVAREGTRTLARAVAPYFPWHWDGEHHFVYLPPDKETEQPIVTRNGGVVHIARPIFTAYHEYAPVPLRQMVGNILASLHPEPMVRTSNLPSFARVTVAAQSGRRMVYVTGYVPERRGAQIDMIEEPIEMRDVVIALRLDGRNVKKAYLAPAQTEVPVTFKDGYATAAIPAVKGWAVVVFEE